MGGEATVVFVCLLFEVVVVAYSPSLPGEYSR